MAERLSGRRPDSQGFCGVRRFDEPQAGWPIISYGHVVRDYERNRYEVCIDVYAGAAFLRCRIFAATGVYLFTRLDD